VLDGDTTEGANVMPDYLGVKCATIISSNSIKAVSCNELARLPETRAPRPKSWLVALPDISGDSFEYFSCLTKIGYRSQISKAAFESTQ
jgi:hypothetical protein